jgi:dolichol kinase
MNALIILLVLGIVFLVLIINEILWRKRKIYDELSRKFIHILVGSFVAFWPFFLTWREIEYFSLAFMAVVLISKKINIFRAIHSVQRTTWGELFFAMSVGGIALLTHDKWIFMIALLTMSLADGLAAVIGSNFKIGFRYQVFGHTKSTIGSFTFFVVSLILLISYGLFVPAESFKLVLVLYAFIATFLENISIAGFDNLTIPIFIALVLRFY